jgi:hypothetical protein
LPIIPETKRMPKLIWFDTGLVNYQAGIRKEIKSAIAGLQKGELIIKDHTMAALGLGGKSYKKIKVTHLI